MRPLFLGFKPLQNRETRLFALVFRVAADVSFTGKNGQGLSFHLVVKHGRLGEVFVVEGELAIAFRVGEVAPQGSINRVGTGAVFIEGVEGVVVVVPAANDTLCLFLAAIVVVAAAIVAAGNEGQSHDDYCNHRKITFFIGLIY